MKRERRILMSLLRRLLRSLSQWDVVGGDDLPNGGPLLVVFNHIAHLDGPLVVATLPWDVEGIVLADLYQVPITGLLLRTYGSIAVHRDAFSRSTVRRAIQVLASGGILALAPEARRSPTFTLERGRTGAAYLALRTQSPILPIGITGTESVTAAWKRLRRPWLTVRIGSTFRLPGPLLTGDARHSQLSQGRDEIMRHIAALLPESYRGVYA